MRKQSIKFLCIILVAAMCLAVLAGCNFRGMSSAEFDSYLNDLTYYMLNGDALSINFLLSDPSTYGLENSAATLYTPILDADEYYSTYSSYASLCDDLFKFNYSTLTDSQKDTWNILMNEFTSLAAKKDYFYFQDGYLGSVSGINCNLPVELAEFDFAKQLDVENYLSLLSQSESAFKSYCDYEKIRVDNGYGRSDSIYQGIVDQCNGFAPADKDGENFLIADFDAKIDAADFLTAEQKADYKAQNLDLLTTKFLPAYRSTAAAVSQFIGNPENNALGLYYYENGANFYQYEFSDKTATSDTVQIAFNNLRSFYNKTLNDYFAAKDSFTTKYGEEKLDSDLSSFTENQDLSLASLENVISKLEIDISADFPSLPVSIPQPTFNFVDETLADFYSPAAYFLSTADSLSSPEVIYINSYSDSDYNVYELLSHEGYPGHLLQNAYFKSTGAHPVRRLFGFTGYSEGWAVYTQIYTAKYFSEDAEQTAAYNLYHLNSVLSGLRVSMIDLLVNAYGYDVADVADFITLTGIALEDPALTDYAQRLLDFVVENPANYPCYYYGYYKMFTLKSDYQDLYGTGYTDLKFHTAVLTAGPMSYDLLYKKLLG